MSDETTKQQTEVKDGVDGEQTPTPNVQEPNKQDKPEEGNLVPYLRKQIEKRNARIKELEQADEDKRKTLEEKLVEREALLKQKEQEINQLSAKADIEKKLLANNVNPEMLDLMLEKAISAYDPETSDVDYVISELKTKYPSAYSEQQNKPQPIGKVGVTATASKTAVLTKDELAKKILDPNSTLTAEENKLADEYGL